MYDYPRMTKMETRTCRVMDDVLIVNFVYFFVNNELFYVILLLSITLHYLLFSSNLLLLFHILCPKITCKCNSMINTICSPISFIFCNNCKFVVIYCKKLSRFYNIVYGRNPYPNCPRISLVFVL